MSERTVGSIRIVEPLATGGMGEIYLGWDPQLERRVVLKAVRRDRLDERSRARLLREAQILSSLDDPRICRLYDYVEGTDNDWLVLELVEGRTLDEVDLAELDRDFRLGIAQQLAEVLMETHSKGIVHRDLKPSNLMLQSDGAIKVLDFGVARLDTDQDPARTTERHPSQTAETDGGEILGTLLYMSPEQARGERVGTASDLYAFGLVLRQLLADEPPYPPDLPLATLLRRLVNNERPDPSAGGAIDADMARLIGELTEPDPDHRPSAAMVVRRLAWERGRPKRRRRRLLAGSALAVILTAGFLYTLELRATMRQSIEARSQAEQARDDARELSDFLVGLFATSGDGPAAESLTARRILERGHERMVDLDQRPRLRAAVALTLGEVYQSLGDYERAKRLIEESLQLRRRAPEHIAELAESLEAKGTVERLEANWNAAIAAFEEALDLQLRAFGTEHEDVAETLNGLAIVKRRQGHFEEAEELYLRSLAIRESVLGPRHPAVARSLNNLGLLYYYKDDLERAETMYRRTLEIKEATLAANHPSLALSLNNLANLLCDLGNYAEAETLYHRNLEIWTEIAGPEHPETATATKNLGLLYEETGRWDQAERSLRRALDIRAESIGREHPEYATDLSDLGYLYVLWRRFDEADEALGKALTLQQKALPADHLDLVLTRTRLAALALGRGQPTAARSIAEEALVIYRELFGPSGSGLAFPLFLLALADLATGEFETAAQRLENAAEAYRTLPPLSAERRHQLARVAEARQILGGESAERISYLVAPGNPEAMAAASSASDSSTTIVPNG